MRDSLPQSLIRLADACPAPLYLVGGSVRDYLSGVLRPDADWDLASPMKEEQLLAACEKCGIHVRGVYRATGTVKLEDDERNCFEFTRFRSDKYVRGMHTPTEIVFTDDLEVDARRRDFCANAVYYDVKAGTFSDPLGGTEDIRNRQLSTVREAGKVFGEDGLRLLRLARIAAQTGFSPTEETLAGARRHAALIEDIAPERIYAEFCLLLHADEKHGDASAPCRGLSILRDTTVLRHTMPELALGEGMSQRSDYHKYDVLEHSFRCVRYAPPSIRWAALLHDVGKPACFLKNGNFYGHPEEGARIAQAMLTRLRAPKELTKETVLLIAMHMRDYDGKMGVYKVRKNLRTLGRLIPAMLALKQADYSACRDDLSPAPTVVRWENVLADMKREGVPFTLSELAVNGNHLRGLVPPEKLSALLAALLDFCLEDGRRNTPEVLLAHAAAIAPNLAAAE